MSDPAEKPARVPPRWLMRAAWKSHRGLYRLTRGRLGLRRPKPGGWGTLRLTTTGRQSGRPRSVLVGYVEDGNDLVALAMNGGGAADPAWWLNLQASPEADVVTRDGRGRVRAHAAVGEERERLWGKWREINKGIDGFASLRPRETAVVVLRPEGDWAGPSGRG